MKTRKTREDFINDLIAKGFRLDRYSDFLPAEDFQMNFSLETPDGWEFVVVKSKLALFAGHNSTLSIPFSDMGVEGPGVYSKTSIRKDWKVGTGVVAWGDTYTKGARA